MHFRHFFAVPGAAPAVTAGIPGGVCVGTEREALRDLPQSAQNWAAASFSCPQKLQSVFAAAEVEERGDGEVKPRSPRGKTAWAPNIGREKGGGNETGIYKVVSFLAFPPRP